MAKEKEHYTEFFYVKSCRKVYCKSWPLQCAIQRSDKGQLNKPVRYDLRAYGSTFSSPVCGMRSSPATQECSCTYGHLHAISLFQGRCIKNIKFLILKIENYQRSKFIYYNEIKKKMIGFLLLELHKKLVIYLFSQKY